MKKITLLITLMISSLGFAQPTTSAPLPTKLPADVVSIYSGSYTNIATNYNPGWGQSGTVNVAYNPGDGNLAMAYTNFNYQGTDLTATNASGMEYIHVDIWTSTATNVKVTPINNGTGVTEFLVNVPLVQNGWSSVDIPKSAFTGMTWNSVYQLKFDGQGGITPSTIYLDNIYFWKAPFDPQKDATLSDLKVDGSTVPGFSPAAFTYIYDLVVGTTVVPQITAATTTNAGATTTITQATGIPGNATVVVKSADLSTTNTYTVSFTANTPNPAPTPSTPNAEVLSVYGDTGGFTNKWIPDYTFGSFASKPDLDPTAGVNEAIKMNFAVAGYGEGTNTTTKVSAYNWVHFDYFVPSNQVPGVNGDQVRFILIGGGEFNYQMTPTGSDGTLVKGSWQSVNVPLSFFVTKGWSKANFQQFKLGTESDLNTKIVYFDNIYFSVNQGTVLGTAKFEISNVKMYPNPVKNTLNIEASGTIQKVSVYNLLGQEVMTANPKGNSATLQTSALQKGVYMVTTDIDGKVSTSKVVKE